MSTNYKNSTFELEVSDRNNNLPDNLCIDELPTPRRSLFDMVGNICDMKKHTETMKAKTRAVECYTETVRDNIRAGLEVELTNINNRHERKMKKLDILETELGNRNLSRHGILNNIDQLSKMLSDNSLSTGERLTVINALSLHTVQLAEIEKSGTSSFESTFSNIFKSKKKYLK